MFRSFIEAKAHRCLGDEVGHLDELPGVRVHEGLEPSASLRVLDLHDMRQGERTVLFRDELDGRRVLVKLSGEGRLSLGDGIVNEDGGDRRRDLGCEVTISAKEHVEG